MKKALFLCLTVILVMTMSVSVFATGFVGSPSGSKFVFEYTHENGDCKSVVEIVGYNDRDKLDDETRKEFEDAYNKLKNDPNADKVSDVFAIRFSDCDSHDDHGTTTVILTEESMKDFDGLMQYVNGAWQAVKADKYQVAGDKLTISMEGTGIYAIALKGETVSPETDSLTVDGVSPVWYVLMGVSLAGLAVVAILYSRVKANG